ncbi:MAG: transporter [Pseudomonadota bacterium]
MSSRWIYSTVLAGFLIAAGSDAAFAQSTAPQSLDDAWWTGPMLANSAHTMPKGNMLIESYLYDAISGPANSVNSLTYLLYGVTDRLTLGLVPTAGYNSVRGGSDSSGVQLGDTQLRGQYAITSLDAARGVPDLAIALIQTMPTGKYDRLGTRPSDGFGGGAYSTALALYSQMVFWMPNGRLLRTRLDLSQGISSRASVTDVSVYGTSAGFRGHARPGNNFSADAAFEYSLTRSWVLALDVIYNHNNNSVTRGTQGGQSVVLNSGTSDSLGFAPAVEFSWTPNIGVLAGVRIIPKGHHTPASVTPAVAINYVL